MVAEPAMSVHRSAQGTKAREHRRPGCGGAGARVSRGVGASSRGKEALSPGWGVLWPLPSRSAALVQAPVPRDCVMATRGFWGSHWMGMGRAAGRTAAPTQEGGVSLPSKLDVFSRRMGFKLVDDDRDPASSGECFSLCRHYPLCQLPSPAFYSLLPPG